MKTILSEFDAPPINEAVLGLEFSPLAKWSIPHFGLFWNQLRDEYPRCEIKPPLAQQEERFGEAQRALLAAPSLQFEFVQQPEVRCWFHDRSEHRLLQIQADRFIHNWRKQGDADEPYPRYENIRPIFEREWARFNEFVKAEDLGPVAVNQCEVTYVNHLEQGREWTSLADLPNVLTFWKGSGATHPAPESVQVVMSFVRDSTRLRVQLHHAIRNADLKEILVFTLSARGRPSTGQPQDILRWMDDARAWLVRSFEELTTARMHALWKRRS
jgi:uncharacterized protein (TIGR04255 family)